MRRKTFENYVKTFTCLCVPMNTPPSDLLLSSVNCLPQNLMLKNLFIVIKGHDLLCNLIESPSMFAQVVQLICSVVSLIARLQQI